MKEQGVFIFDQERHLVLLLHIKHHEVSYKGLISGKALKRLRRKLMEICERLHNILLKGKKFYYNSDLDTMPHNGIYILYEKGEREHGSDRIVRIGTHTGENLLRSRICEHFFKENKNRSIFRKNIGRAILNKESNPYLTVWNCDPTTKANKEKLKAVIDKDFESKVEKQISKYIQENFYFKLLAVAGKDNRLELEEKLIGTVSSCKKCKPSTKWFGNYSPIDKIRESGLWQVQGLYSVGLTENDLKTIEKYIV